MVVIVLHVCNHLSSFYLPVVFSFLYVKGFHYYYCHYYFILVYFGQLPLNVFGVAGAHVCVVLFYFVYLFVRAGACGWVVDIDGHVASPILQGFGCCFGHLTSTFNECC